MTEQVTPDAVREGCPMCGGKSVVTELHIDDDHHRYGVDIPCPECARVGKLLAAATADRERIVAALRPFAALDVSSLDGKSPATPIYGRGATFILLGDVLAARAALAAQARA